MASKTKTVKVINDHGPMGWVLFMSFVGALIYFVQHSEGFWGFILAILKAGVWPAYVLYNVLEVLNI